MFMPPSSLGICATQRPRGAAILHVSSLPCYFWLLKQQRTNIPFSYAQLVQEESVRYRSAARSNTSRPCVAPLVCDND